MKLDQSGGTQCPPFTTCVYVYVINKHYYYYYYRGKRVFITNVKGTFLGMSESEEASKRR
jgi:hypothetical protein